MNSGNLLGINSHSINTETGEGLRSGSGILRHQTLRNLTTERILKDSPFVLLVLLDGGHPFPRLLVHVVVGVYPHLVLDVAHVLQLLALALLDALHRAAALDVRDREAKFLHIVTVAGGKRQVALPVGELNGGIECGAEFELRKKERGEKVWD